MTYVVDVCTGQRVVNEFLVAKGYSPMEIERRQRSAYGKDAIDAQLDTGPVVSRAVKRALATGLASAATTETKHKVDELTRDDCSITRGPNMDWKTGDYGHHQRLGYRKVCARWVPKILTEEHKTARKNTCAELLQHSENDGDVSVRNNNQL
jgi:hypothetical protein